MEGEEAGLARERSQAVMQTSQSIPIGRLNDSSERSHIGPHHWTWATPGRKQWARQFSAAEAISAGNDR